MISKISQDSLFPHGTIETLKENSISTAVASQLFRDGLLSFDPSEKEELNNFEYFELDFVSSLLNSGLTLTSVEFLLSKLEKPYCYSINELFFDFKNKEWKMFPVFIEPEVEELIENIIEDEDLERLGEIKNRIVEFLDEYKDKKDD